MKSGYLKDGSPLRYEQQKKAGRRDKAGTQTIDRSAEKLTVQNRNNIS
jgi:hypothetical protein